MLISCFGDRANVRFVVTMTVVLKARALQVMVQCWGTRYHPVPYLSAW